MRRWRRANPSIDKQKKKLEYASDSDTAARRRARNYVAVYRRRWGLETPICAGGCGVDNPMPYHPDPTAPRRFIWLCRACQLKAPLLARMVADGYLIELRPPPRARTEKKPTRRGPNAAPARRLADPPRPYAPLSSHALAVARSQVALAANLGRVSPIALAEYYLAQLAEHERIAVDVAGRTADLGKWRAFGVDDLDLSLLNLYYRRRLRERARESELGT